MKNFKSLLLVISFFLYLGIERTIAQCGVVDPIVTTNYCANQTAAWSIANSSPSNTIYSWYQYNSATSTYQKNGTGDYYETAQTFPNGYGTVNTYYYEKEIHQTPVPAFPGTPPPVGGNTAGPVVLNYSSSTDFTLNYLIVAVHANWTGSTSTYAVKVSANGQFSQWFTFKYTSASVVAISGSTVYVRVPVYQSPSQLGLPIPSGNAAISVSTCSVSDPCPPGVVAVDGFDYLPTVTSGLSGTYPLGSTMSLDYTSSIQNIWGNNSYPGIFAVDVTIKCGKTPVTAIQETDNTKCCTPVASYSTVTSNKGTNIFDTIFPPATTLTASGNSAALYYVWYKDGVAMGPAFQGVGKTTISISDYGIYTVKVVQNATFVNRAVCYKTTPFEAQKRQLFAVADPKTICLGSAANLVAKGATANILWTTATSAPITNAATQVASTIPPSIGKYLYTVQADVPLGNLVVNGDFEKGNTGFSSTYLFKDAATATNPTVAEQFSEEGYPTRKVLNLGNGAYTINDYVFWPGWNSWKICKGHGGIGNFLYTDAATTAGSYVWEQTVNVIAGKTYEFSAWVTNIDTNAVVNPSGNPLPQATIFIDGTSLFTPYIPISATTCLWQKISQTWTATTTGPITLRVDEISKVNNGNDFAIDDIAFGTPGTQTDTVSVTVQACALPVVFLSYGISKVNEGVKIDWKTVSEYNASLFVVQRSDDGGKSFYDVGIVPARQSGLITQYSFVDVSNTGSAYYRIREVDSDGRGMYSTILEYQSEAIDQIKVFPNPSETSFNIASGNTEVLKVDIYDITGKYVCSIENNAESDLNFGKELLPGMYMLEIRTTSGNIYRKISKQ